MSTRRETRRSGRAHRRTPAGRKPAEPKAALDTLAALRFDPNNPNRGTDRGREAVASSLEEVGAARSIVTTRDLVVMAGNKTLAEAKRRGLRPLVVHTRGEELVVVVRDDVESNSATAKKIAVYDNRAGELGLDWDPEVLAALGEEIPLERWFSQEELAEILGEDVLPVLDETSPPLLDKAAELQGKWKTARGQLWKVPSRAVPGGVHLLLCGDATNKNDVHRLMGQERALWCWTDPPFGVAYEGRTPDALTIQNDDPHGLPDLLRDGFAAADEVLVAGAPIYVCHPAGPLSLEFCRAFVEVGWHHHQSLVWVKDTLVLGHSDFHYRHEGILYGWRKGRERFWYGGRDQDSVLEVARPKVNEFHPTIKPVELVVRCLKNSTKMRDLGYEPFAGSGTTLVAAEQTGRLCRALEVDPRYVAVALERLSSLGLEPALIR
jgi:DNA modification methylase